MLFVPVGEASIFGGFIPPTPSFKTIKAGLDNVTASNYTSHTTFVEGSGIDIIADYLANTITFSTTGSGTGNATVLDELGDVTVSNPQYHSILGYNGTQWINKIFALWSTTCGGTDKVSSINNQTGTVTCTPDLVGGSGNSTVLNDLGDVILSSANYGDILFHNGISWINKQFLINNQTNNVDFQIIGINNQTGEITRNQFSVNSITCAGSDRVSAIDNATGQVTCTTVTGGSGNATNLNDLGDVVITSPANNHIIQYRSGQWINKLFQINTQSPANDFQITGIDNQTGIITRNQFSVNNFTNTNGLTKDVFVTGINNVTGQLNTNQFSVNSNTCGANQFVSLVDNVTGTVTCTTPTGGSGNATVLNDLGDVVLTSPSLRSILQLDSVGQWIDKVFSVNNQTNHGDQFIIGINNNTGLITRKQFSINNFSYSGPLVKDQFLIGINNVTGVLSTNTFSVNTRTCSGTDKVSAIDNVTGSVTCSTDSTGSGSGGIPTTKRWGSLNPTSASATLDGILGGCTILATATYNYNTTHTQIGILSTTAVTDGTNGGIHCVATDRNIYRGAQNPYMYSDWHNNRIGGTNRMFIGFSSGATALPNNADTILDALNGAGLCIRTTDTVYQFCHNDGTGATAYQSLTTTENTSRHFFEVYTTDNGATWCGKLDGGTAVCSSVVTDIPTPTTRMYPMSSSETDGGALSAIFHQHHLYVQQDM